VAQRYLFDYKTKKTLKVHKKMSQPQSRESMQRAMAEAQASINQQAQQALSEKLSTVCITRCLSGGPTEKLTDRQRRCLDACTSSFLEGFQVSAETFAAIAKRSAATDNE
jgi:hypothetical protein